MKKKLISVMLTLCMTASVLAGCAEDELPGDVGEESSESGNEEAATEDAEESSEEETDAAEAEDTETADDSAADAETAESIENDQVEVDTDSALSADAKAHLEEIAKADGISYEDLNVKVDDQGYVTFLGNSYYDSEIKDEDDALLSLESISDLIGLDGIELDFYKTNVSQVSGNTYYTFYQVDTTEIDGQKAAVKYYNNLIKIAVDKDGKTEAISTYLNHEETPEIEEDDLLDRDEVNDYVISLLGDPSMVLTDETNLVYWNDQDTSMQVSTGKVILAYVVYVKNDIADQIADELMMADQGQDDSKKDDTVKEEASDDETDKNAEDFEEAEYVAFVVDAFKHYTDESKENYTIAIVSQFQCNTINTEESGQITSLYFFAGREDAGEYTYTLSRDWVKDAYSDYSGPDTAEVTLPVIYDPDTKLYYLADYNRKIVMGNYYDVNAGGISGDGVNPVVTETPEDLDSWHFLNESNEAAGIEEYFFDPDYALAVYNNMITIYDMFHERYGLNGVDETGIPILSVLYTYDDEYPEKVSDFQQNASCAGQFNDWILVCTSPALAACISPTVMGHELTHGVNQQLTSSQYFNQPGAMMESYADIIGEELAILYADDPVHEEWVLGGDYCKVMRDFRNPSVNNNPKYIGGADYMPATLPEFGSVLDMGGVHTNSGVTNYLAYKLTHEEEAGLQDGEEILDVGTNVDMWFETLFLATYITDFNDVAHYLTYTSTVTGVSDGQQKLLARLLKEHGLFGDCEEFEQLLAEEDRCEFTYSFDWDKDDFTDRYEICVQNIKVDSEDPDEIDSEAGIAIPEDGKATLVQSSDFNNMPAITIIDKATGESVTERLRLVTKLNALETNDVTCHIKEVSLTSDKKDKFTVADGEKISYISPTAEEWANELYIDGQASFTKYGRFIVVTTNEDDSNSGEFTLYLITVADD